MKVFQEKMAKVAKFKSSLLSTVSERVTWVSISGDFPLNKRMPIFTTLASTGEWISMDHVDVICPSGSKRSASSATKKLRKYLVLRGAS